MTEALRASFRDKKRIKYARTFKPNHWDAICSSWNYNQ